MYHVLGLYTVNFKFGAVFFYQLFSGKDLMFLCSSFILRSTTMTKKN